MKRHVILVFRDFPLSHQLRNMAFGQHEFTTKLQCLTALKTL